MAAAAASIDLGRPGKYPIVLSDALLGKASKESYVGIRYNHKPDQSSDSAQNSIQLQPSESDPARYDLSLSDNAEEYTYNGVQTSDNGQYVLVFDAANKCFVLHQIDSTFDMNLVKAPWEDDASTLRSQYSQLEVQTPTKQETQAPQRRSSKSARSTASTKAEPKRRKAAEKPKKKPPPREPTPDEGDESDNFLTIEYPDEPATSQKQKSLPSVHRHNNEERSDEEAEGEDYANEKNEDVDMLRLPSPANNAGGISDEDLELDLEAELEEALKQDARTGAGESDESEEE